MDTHTNGPIRTEKPTKITHIYGRKLTRPMTPGELSLQFMLPAALAVACIIVISTLTR